MKRVCTMIMIVALLICTLTNISNAAFEINNSVEPISMKIGDIVTYTITANENIVATNFDISYESGKFKLEGSGTTGLSVSEKNGKIACIYADISGIGTKEFKIKFKAIAETGDAAFSINNYKFRVQNVEESYTDVIKNPINKVNVSNNAQNDNTQKENTKNNNSTDYKQKNEENTNKTPDKTISTKKLPYAGKNNFIFLMIFLVVLFAIIFKQKDKKLKNIFKSGGIMLLAITLIPAVMHTSKVKAASNTLEVKFYDNLISGKNNALIINETNKTKLTKSEVMTLDNKIIDITNINGISLNENDNVKTKDIIKVSNGDSYSVILYGDSNCDGIICDTDDIMNIINDYLGKKEITNEEKIAANLENRDEVLDTDDIMVMINTYLGKDTKIVSKIPTGNIDIVINKPEEDSKDNTGKLLQDVAKIGDYINYPKTYTNVKSTRITSNPVLDELVSRYQPKGTGWRVLSNKNKVIKIMTVGCPETKLYSEGIVSFITNTSNFKKYVDSNYAISAIGAPTEEEATNCKNIEDWFNNWSLYIGSERYIFYLTSGKICDCGTIKEHDADGTWYEDGEPITLIGNGIMPVVTLKNNLVITSGDGTKENPYEVKISQ